MGNTPQSQQSSLVALKIATKKWDIQGQNCGSNYYVIISLFRNGKLRCATERSACSWITKRLWKNTWKVSSQIPSHSDTVLSVLCTQIHVLPMQTVLSRNACANVFSGKTQDYSVYFKLSTTVILHGDKNSQKWVSGETSCFWWCSVKLHTLCVSQKPNSHSPVIMLESEVTYQWSHAPPPGWY